MILSIFSEVKLIRQHQSCYVIQNTLMLYVIQYLKSNNFCSKVMLFCINFLNSLVINLDPGKRPFNNCCQY